MKASLDNGRPVQVDGLLSLADALGGGIGLDNKLTFAMCRALVDDIVLVSETEVAAGIRHAYEIEREIIEGAGAVGIGALLARKVTGLGRPAALLLSAATSTRTFTGARKWDDQLVRGPRPLVDPQRPPRSVSWPKATLVSPTRCISPHDAVVRA